MGDFAVDTALKGGDGHTRARISPDGEVWEPLVGHAWMRLRESPPNPNYEQELEQRRKWEAQRRPAAS